eukprot:Tamp_02467.p1 GENE.Tamp_02467~~Tamp_02467.p1  ORF type:complete len:773 (+),score=145.98 Tamp_02467:678-2996(+)
MPRGNGWAGRKRAVALRGSGPREPVAWQKGAPEGAAWSDTKGAPAVPEPRCLTGSGGAGAQKHNSKSAKKTESEAPVLFTSDAQSFPVLDLAAPPPVPRGSWAADASSAGRWSRPLDVETPHASGALLRHKAPAHHEQTQEQEWITVAPKLKAASRTETASAQAYAPSAWGGWGARAREAEGHGQLSAPPKSARMAPTPPGPPAGAAPADARKAGKKAPILLSELMPVLRRKDVKMPTPYTAKQRVEMDSSKHKAHKRTENLVRNPNAADSQNQFVVLRRKEREGGSKKKKISPLKKLILRDRKERLERQASADAAAAAHGDGAGVAAASAQPEGQSAGDGGDGGDAEGGSAVDTGVAGHAAHEASQLAVEWLSERGMDPSNPEHVQHLLNSLNEEEEEDDDESDEDNGEGAKQCALSQLPSAVSWTQQLHSGPLRARARSADDVAHTATTGDGVHTATTGDGGAGGAASRGDADGRAIPQWAQVNAPEFRPAAQGVGHASPHVPPGGHSSATEASLAVSAGWSAKTLGTGSESAPLKEQRSAGATPPAMGSDSTAHAGGGGSGEAKSPKKKGRGRGSAGVDQARAAEGKDGKEGKEGQQVARPSEAAAQTKKVTVTTGSVNHGDGKNNKMLVRDYCDQKLDEGLNVMVDAFLRKLNELQERLRERDALKAKMKRRLQVPDDVCLLRVSLRCSHANGARTGKARVWQDAACCGHGSPLSLRSPHCAHKKENKWGGSRDCAKYTAPSARRKRAWFSSLPTSSPVRAKGVWTTR